MEQYILIGFTAFLGTLFAGGAIVLAKLLSFRSPDSLHKRQAYECSETPIGDARIRFKVAFYIFALLFLLFDIESLFLFPCMKIFRAVASGAAGAVTINLLYLELFGFIFVLFSGLLYAWRKGVLVWE
ncbi:NADH-quinone oxidoreductase subunit A [Candidatus Electronema sp. JM]|uniref:NADH-quinone oxidoreductase subunit A n=1 Tax=Candidatus Electronema sp. JM TaxID=3401571 RepID=UPI003AA957B8